MYFIWILSYENSNVIVRARIIDSGTWEPCINPAYEPRKKNCPVIATTVLLALILHRPHFSLWNEDGAAVGLEYPGPDIFHLKWGNQFTPLLVKSVHLKIKIKKDSLYRHGNPSLNYSQKFKADKESNHNLR